jgi:hypothetical protein
MTDVKVRPGDHVLLLEAGFGYEYRILPDGENDREVLEVGLDYVVLRGEGDVLTIRIPAYLLTELPPHPGRGQLVGEPQRARSEAVTTSVQDVAA